MNSRVRNNERAGTGLFELRSSLWRREEASPPADLLPIVRTHLGDLDPHGQRRLLDSLAGLNGEGDLTLRQHGLIYLAREQEQENRPELAAGLYRSAIQIGGDPETGRRAEAALAALGGAGPWGLRFEAQLRNFSRQVTDPGLLASMGIAGAVFSAARAATLSGLLGSGSRAWWAHGLGAQAVAWGSALAIEAPAFTLSVRGFRTLQGESLDWSGGALTRDVLANGLTLFSLKAMGGLSARGLRGIRARPGLNPTWVGLSERALPQVGMFSGILGARYLETAWGLREAASPDVILSESLVTLLHFNVAGRLVPRFHSEDIHGRIQSLENRAAREPLFSRVFDLFRLAPTLRPNTPRGLAPAGIGEIPNSVWMSSQEGDPPKPTPAQVLPSIRAREREMVPVFSDTETYLAFRSQFSRLEADITFLFNEQPGTPLYLAQGLRTTIETHTMIRNFWEHIPDRTHRPALESIARDLTISYQNLMQIAHQEYYSRELNLEETWKRYLGPIARISNKAINFLFTGDPADLNGSVISARSARGVSYELAQPFLVNADAMEITKEPEAPPYRDMFALPEFPEPVRLPAYDYIMLPGSDQESFDIPGVNRQVVLMGEIPHNRAELSSRHQLEVITRDRQLAMAMMRRTMDAGDATRIRFSHRDPRGQIRTADYVEAYEPLTYDELLGSEGTRNLREILLSKIKIGGIGYVVSHQARVIEEMSNILFRQGLGDVIWGSLSAPPLVSFEGAEDLELHTLQFRKIAE